MENQSPRPSRVHLLDELRGVLIIYVVAYHALYDLAVLFPGGITWLYDGWMNTLRDFMVGALVIISGIVSHYARSNLRRGAVTFGWGLALTAATVLVIPSQTIIFGILHFFGSAMMLYALLEKPLSKIPTWPGTVLSILLFFFTKNIYYGTVGLFGFHASVPAFFYNHYLLYPLGFACAGVSSADYYPLLPWFFLFLTGGFLGRLVRAGRFPACFYKSHLPPLAWIGSHTLIIYLLHQPILYGVLYLIFALL